MIRATGPLSASRIKAQPPLFGLWRRYHSYTAVNGQELQAMATRGLNPQEASAAMLDLALRLKGQVEQTIEGKRLKAHARDIGIQETLGSVLITCTSRVAKLIGKLPGVVMERNDRRMSGGDSVVPSRYH